MFVSVLGGRECVDGCIFMFVCVFGECGSSESKLARLENKLNETSAVVQISIRPP